MAWKQKRQVMQRYDVTAQMYDERYCAEQSRKYKKALKSVDVTDLTVLDVGCGSGNFFGEIAEKAKFVVGMDVSRGLLKLAKVQAKMFDNVFVVQADADHLPFCSSDLFGAVFLFTVLQNMPTPIRTLKELKGAIVIGGWVVVSGLKKAYGLEKFMDILESTGWPIVAFVDEEAVNCYIAVLVA